MPDAPHGNPAPVKAPVVYDHECDECGRRMQLGTAPICRDCRIGLRDAALEEELEWGRRW